MTRWKAAAIHSSISAIIALFVGTLFLGVWYPPPYFRAAGADELMLLLIGVDLGIGPLLTLIVFRSGKKGLRFDLTAIGVIQTIALIYGLWVVLQSRPVFLVGVVDRLVLVSANEITDADLALGKEERFRSRSWTGPRLVAATVPTDQKERDELTFKLGGPDLQNLPKYYRDYADAGKTLLANAKQLQSLRQKHPNGGDLVDRWLSAENRKETSVRWVPLESRKVDMVILIDAATAEPLKAFPIDPW